jgi:hypothetical protein
MRFVHSPLAVTLALSLLAAPAAAQEPKGAPKGRVSPPAEKAPAAPKDVAATQAGDTVVVTWQGDDPKAASFQVYVASGGRIRAITKVVATMARQAVLRVAEIAAVLGVPASEFIGRLVSFSVEAIDPKGLVSPKANSSPIVLKGPSTSPADPGPTTTTPTTPTSTLPASSAGPKDPTLPDKAWAAQTSRSDVTLAWRAAKDATAHRVFFVFGGRRFALGTFVPGVTRAVFTLQRLSSMVGQPLAGLQKSPMLFEIETLIGQRVAGLLRFNEVIPVSPEKGLAAKQAPGGVHASQTGEREITVTWQPVQDATAYAIGRAVGKQGFQMICGLCPTDTRFVDTEATPGVKHVYTVQAITADGMGLRATSNPVPDEGSKSGTQK